MSEWKLISDLPDKNMGVLYYFKNRTWTDQEGKDASFGEMRDHVEKTDVGFYEDGTWRESGTAHDIFEDWRSEADKPTHWAPLLAPPEEPKP